MAERRKSSQGGGSNPSPWPGLGAGAFDFPVTAEAGAASKLSVDPAAYEHAFETVGHFAVRSWGEGVPLVLFHGGAGSWRHWIANIRELSRHFHVLAVDLPGFGSAPLPPTGPRDVDGYLSCVRESFCELAGQYGPMHLAAFSFGAAVSGEIVRLSPETLRAVTLLSPGGFSDGRGRAIDLRPVPPAAADLPGHRAALAHNLGQVMTAEVPEPDDAVVDLQMVNVARMRFNSRRVSLRAQLPQDLSGSYMPMQVIWGRKDQLVAPDSIEARMQRLCAVRPDAEIRVLPHGAHWIQYEQPAAVNALLVDFHLRETA